MTREEEKSRPTRDRGTTEPILTSARSIHTAAAWHEAMSRHVVARYRTLRERFQSRRLQRSRLRELERLYG